MEAWSGPSNKAAAGGPDDDDDFGDYNGADSATWPLRTSAWGFREACAGEPSEVDATTAGES